MINHKTSTFSLGLEKKPDEILFRHIQGEYSYKKYTLFIIISYILLYVGLILQGLFLASDIYTLIQIYALENWDDFHTITYIPVIVYKIVFTTCIGISFLFLIFTWLRGVMFYKGDRVVKSYLNNGARTIDSIKDYERFCIYEEISTNNFHDWVCLQIYQSFHYDIFNWLLADTPRQSLNGATIAYIVSNKFTDNNIGGTLSYIAQHNKQEAVLLGFMFFSFVIWLCFTFKNIIVILSSICIVSKIRNSGTKFSDYIHSIVANSVSLMYERKANGYEIELNEKRRLPTFEQMTPIKEINNEDPFGELELQTPIPLPTPFKQKSFEKSFTYLQDINESAYSKTDLLRHRTTQDMSRVDSSQIYDTSNPFEEESYEDLTQKSILQDEKENSIIEDSFESYNELGNYIGPHFPDPSKVYPEVEIENGYPEIVLQRYSMIDEESNNNPFQIPHTSNSSVFEPKESKNVKESIEHVHKF